MLDKKRLLAAGLDPETREKLAPALARFDLEVNHVPSGPSARELVEMIRFDILLLGLPLPDLDPADLLATLRDPTSRSRQAAALVFAAPELLGEAEPLLARGATQVLATDRPAIDLQEAVLGLLRTGARLAVRVMTRLTVRLGEADSQFLCQTQDLSRSGLLAITDRVYPPGTAVRFAIELPGATDSVRGEAEIVRVVAPSREHGGGLGVRFASFVGDGERRLYGFLAQHGA
jgi:CheY-like chemotaxis protein